VGRRDIIMVCVRWCKLVGHIFSFLGCIPLPLFLLKLFKTLALGPDLIFKVFIVKDLFFSSP